MAATPQPPARIATDRTLTPEHYAVLVTILGRLGSLRRLTGAGVEVQLSLARDELRDLLHQIGNGRRVT